MSALIIRLGGLLLLLSNVACAEDLWDLKRLDAPPATEPAESFGASNVQAVYLAGEPYKGKPTKIFAYYNVPPGATKEAPVPGVVCVHGGGGTAFAEWVQIWNRHGYAAIALDTNGAVPRNLQQSPDEQRHDWAGPLRYGFGEAGDDPHDQWPYHAVTGVILAHSLLRSLPGVNAEQTGVTGISWGGYLTSLVAGIDPRFKFAIPVYGCGFYHEGTSWNDAVDAYGRERWVKLWDPSTYLANVRYPMLWVNGTNDEHYHLPLFQKSYRLPRGPRQLAIRVRMDHGHGSGWSPQEIYAFADAVLGRGPQAPTITQQGETDGQARVEFTCESPTRVDRAEFNWTTDSGDWRDWRKRKWSTQPAKLNGENRASAPLPGGTTAYYFNLFDDRGLLVSSEHVTLPAP